jgi:hypothetical protein
MKNESIFQGIKELGDLRVVEEGSVWGIYEKQQDGSFVRVATICKISGESNRRLHARAAEFVERDWLADAGFTA